MRSLHALTGASAAGLFLSCVVSAAVAVPITPKRDDEVIEVLPATPAAAVKTARLRKRLAERPGDAALALTRRAALPRAGACVRRSALRRPGAGGAAAVARRRRVADDVLLMRATLQQYLHEFDAAVATCDCSSRGPDGERKPQAWLTLATVRRVQGRYAESDAACRDVAGAGAQLYAAACLAENRRCAARSRRRARLRGDAGRSALPAAARGWLMTSLAELEERDGRAAAGRGGLSRRAASSAPTPTRRSPTPTS